MWHDSILDTSGWINHEEYDFDDHETAMRMETVGYLVHHTDNAIFVAQSVANKQVAAVVSIPSGCIKSILKIKEADCG